MLKRVVEWAFALPDTEGSEGGSQLSARWMLSDHNCLVLAVLPQACRPTILPRFSSLGYSGFCLEKGS